MTSDLASTTLTLDGGGLLPAKNCAIMWLRKALKPTKAPTSSANADPTMINQRTVRIGRVRAFSAIGLPEMLASVAMFMSCTFCSYRLSRLRRPFAIQMRSNCGLVKSDPTKKKFAKLPFEVGGIAVSEARHGRKPR